MFKNVGKTWHSGPTTKFGNDRLVVDHLEIYSLLVCNIVLSLLTVGNDRIDRAFYVCSVCTTWYIKGSLTGFLYADHFHKFRKWLVNFNIGKTHLVSFACSNRFFCSWYKINVFDLDFDSDVEVVFLCWNGFKPRFVLWSSCLLRLHFYESTVRVCILLSCLGLHSWS